MNQTVMTMTVILAGAVGCAALSVDDVPVFYCSPDGEDRDERGTEAEPFKTVGYALEHIGSACGATVVLLDGEYGRVRADQAFDRPVAIRARNEREAVFEGLFVVGAKNLTFDGLTIDHRNSERAANVVQISRSSYITVRNCLITHGRDGFQNTDTLKINQRSHHVLIEGNEIFDATDEEIDILGDTHDIVVRRNIVYQYRTRERPEALVSNKMGASRGVFEGNLFANLNPRSSNGALRFGGGERAGQESRVMIAVGNLFVNTVGRGAQTFVGSKKSLVAHNIFVNHDDRRTGPIAIYSNYPRGDIANDDVFVINNVFYNVGSDRPVYWFGRDREHPSFPENRLFAHNLYWNPDRSTPRSDIHELAEEEGALFADPLFVGDPSKLEGRPTAEWFEILELRPESPFLDNKIDLTELDLPDELRRFLRDYRGEGDDPWYREINRDRRP